MSDRTQELERRVRSLRREAESAALATVQALDHAGEHHKAAEMAAYHAQQADRRATEAAPPLRSTPAWTAGMYVRAAMLNPKWKTKAQQRVPELADLTGATLDEFKDQVAKEQPDIRVGRFFDELPRERLIRRGSPQPLRARQHGQESGAAR